MNRLDLSGQRFGRLTALSVSAWKPVTIWLLRCDCGNDVLVRQGNLRNGHTRSCGCLNDRTQSLIHGHERDKKPSRTLKSYRHAKSRCFSRSDPKYKTYGGRGITMCAEWVVSFSAFLKDMGECPEGMTLDRINNDGDYEPGNCRWATHHEQSNNRSNNIIVEVNGETLSLKEYAHVEGVHYQTAHRRWHDGKVSGYRRGRSADKIAGVLKR